MSQETFEHAVLGACLLDEKAMSWCHRSVDSDHFVSKANRHLFEILNSMYVTGKPIDLVTVLGHMSAADKKLVDPKKLIQATEAAGHVANVEHYAELARKGSVSWRLERLYEKLKMDPNDEDCQRDVKRLWDEFGGRIGSARSMTEAVDAYRLTLERRKHGREFCIYSGFERFDRIVGGFYAGYMVALGARTSIGKTTAFLHLAYRFLKQKAKVLFISAEMSCDEMIDRLISMNCDIPAGVLRRGHIEQNDMRKIDQRLGEFKDLPMVWIEGGRMSLTRMRTAIQTYKPSIVFVDFIQRFIPSNPNVSRAAYFSDLANEMKAIAMEQKLICFAASQFSRAIEFDKTRKPQLSDFKESGGIEESADVCIAIHPVGEDDQMSDFRELEWQILKNRHGPTGAVTFMFRKKFTQFFEKEEAEARDGKSMSSQN